MAIKEPCCLRSFASTWLRNTSRCCLYWWLRYIPDQILDSSWIWQMPAYIIKHFNCRARTVKYMYDCELCSTVCNHVGAFLHVIKKSQSVYQYIPVPHLSTLFISEAHAVNTFKSVGMLLRWHTGKQELLTFASIQQPVKTWQNLTYSYYIIYLDQSFLK